MWYSERRGGEGTLGRCLKLYGAILLVHALTVGLLAVASVCGLRNVALTDLALPRSGIEPGLWQILTLQSMLINSCVLALYLILIWLVAFVHRRPLATVAVSVAVYVAVQVWPDTVALPSPWAEAFYFNPFAWQLPFVLGMAYGTAGLHAKSWIPRNIAAPIAAALALELALLIKVGLWVPPVEVVSDKVTLAPLRLVHFYCVLIIGRSLLPRDAGFLKSAILRPVILCGQNPLATYCAGGLLATMGTLLIAKYGSDYGWTFTINVAGWMMSLLVAFAASGIYRWRKTRNGRDMSAKI